MLTFTVFGVAQSKGSHKAFVPRGMKFPIVTESNRNAKSWQQLVAVEASRALQNRPTMAILAGPISVWVVFYLPRPKKHQRRGVALAHMVKPDLDRLLRAVLDALTGVVWIDDAQVVEVVAAKRYAPVDMAPHVIVTVDASTAHAPMLPPTTPPLFDEVTP